MTRTATMIALSVGIALFVGLLAWQGIDAIAATLAVAGWGLALVALFHLLPLLIDASAIRTVVACPHARVSRRPFMLDVVLTRWAGESVNSLLPAGQIGGPVFMARHLMQRGIAMRHAAAGITVVTTLQALAQIVFAFSGLSAFALYTQRHIPYGVHTAALIAGTVLALIIGGFYVAQRRGLFGRLLQTMRVVSKLFSQRNWSALTTHADAIDDAIQTLYRQHRKVLTVFTLSLASWFAGVGEVWLALYFLGHPVDWLDALLLESVGQAIRGAAFAIPGSLGAQEGGYLLLAPLVGLAPDTALALSLAKRARELALGLPGIIYIHWSERNWQRQQAPPTPLANKH